MAEVLVLNKSYRPIGIVSWQRAIQLFFSEKAEILSEYENRLIRSVSTSIKMPSVIRVLANIKRVAKSLRYNKRNVYFRDGGICMYCGDKLALKEATIDHVKSRKNGGKTEWANVVLSCSSCNLRKNDKPHEEMGMKLIRPPFKPMDLSIDYTFTVALKMTSRRVHSSWKQWIPELEGLND